MKKVICIDNSITTSQSRMIEKYLYLAQLEVGKEYTIIGLNNWNNGWLLSEVDNFNGKGYAFNRFIDANDFYSEVESKMEAS